MRFTKMHGAGNDYVYVDGAKEKIADPSAAAVKVSDRHFGVGSDGLILINPSACADFEMEMYNADGSRGRMCGNGIRCVAKYVYDRGMTSGTSVRIETLSGIKTVEIFPGPDGKAEKARVNMGAPVLTPADIPVVLPLLPGGVKDAVIGVPYRIGKNMYAITCVSMGNPHCVVFTEERVEEMQLFKTGPLFETDPLFPERVNTEFVNVIDRHHIRMRVWERGSGETLACGTGACAAAVAAYLNGYTEREVTVSLPGGDLQIEWNSVSGDVFMTGPAVEVYEGDIDV